MPGLALRADGAAALVPGDPLQELRGGAVDGDQGGEDVRQGVTLGLRQGLDEGLAGGGVLVSDQQGQVERGLEGALAEALPLPSAEGVEAAGSTVGASLGGSGVGEGGMARR
ncbi:hypothetical protein [Nonomuraea recticatena]|uniref:hypothetical protein n=1 Tax=Nonomuraea recticatena TaxID=46178 RepID=UPI00360F82E4